MWSFFAQVLRKTPFRRLAVRVDGRAIKKPQPAAENGKGLPLCANFPFYDNFFGLHNGRFILLNDIAQADNSGQSSEDGELSRRKLGGGQLVPTESA